MHRALGRPQLHSQIITPASPCRHVRRLALRRQLAEQHHRGAPSPLKSPCQLLSPRGLAGSLRPLEATPTSAPGTVLQTTPSVLRVTYLRKDHSYKGWGLHVWGDTPDATQWQQPLKPQMTAAHGRGVVWEVRLREGSRHVGLLVHKGQQEAARGEVSISAQGSGVQSVWLVGSEHRAFEAVPDMSHIPAGSVNKQFAHWVDATTLVWRQAGEDAAGPRRFKLHYHSKGYMHITGAGVQGAEEVHELQHLPGALPASVMKRFPHLYGCSVLRLPAEAAQRAAHLVAGQLLVSCVDAEGEPLDATGVQVQGVLDDQLVYSGPLGHHTLQEGGNAITVWAPTAQRVELLFYGKAARGGAAQVHAMTRGSRGEWTLACPPDWMWCYYTYRVTVYCPWTARMESVEVTDPYSRGLAADGQRTQIVDLAHPDTMPPGWAQHDSPPLSQWTDISVYELHVRDFSMSDARVPEPLRGKYLAFCPDRVAGGQALPAGAPPPSHGLAHLAALRAAGLNHLHLLPTYDFATVPERVQDQRTVQQDDLSRYPPDSQQQQSAVLAVADQDGFNWGYDPVHYGVPEGSYATDPDGTARIREFREMVMALHGQGWRVVQDVVYNHVYASGPQSKYSVLDKVVPGYYQRRHEDGAICDSTCCNNTAPEHAMCERLIVDDITMWAREYRVDGFRFDIMGHLMMTTMAKIRASLDSLTLEQHRVAGRSIYLYGEAWDFGEVMANQRGRNAAQMNLAGSGLGSFNDRLRDGAMGGGPFAPPDFQGLVTGLALAPNGSTAQGLPDAQVQELLVLSDWVRASLAGLLRVYPLELSDGSVRPGEQVLCHGLPLAYCAQPCEHVAFIGCHDNKTMFDQIIEKAATRESPEERMRMAVLCLALITLSQGVPFIHAGDDLLRSKSLDRDSYNSGDWFNRIDWTGATHNFGIGLPVSTKNGGSWGYMAPLLAAADAIRPNRATILQATRLFQALLRVRYSSPLFRMPTAADILKQLTFHNTGPRQVPGVVVMELRSAAEGSGGTHDPAYERLVAVFNCSPQQQQVAFPQDCTSLQLHPELQAVGDERLAACGADSAARTMSVAARTAAVFVQPRS